MNTGFIRLSPMDVLRTLFGQGTAKQELILFEFRLPRIIISVLVGAGLALSGAILQGLSRNALADPGILGINAGAGLAVVLFISYYPVKQAAPVYMMPLLAMVGAGAAAALIYVLAYKRHWHFANEARSGRYCGSGWNQRSNACANYQNGPSKLPVCCHMVGWQHLGNQLEVCYGSAAMADYFDPICPI